MTRDDAKSLKPGDPINVAVMGEDIEARFVHYAGGPWLTYALSNGSEMPDGTAYEVECEGLVECCYRPGDQPVLSGFARLARSMGYPVDPRRAV